MRINILAALVLPAAISLAAPAFSDEKIQWSDVPAAVQKTITEHTGEERIKDIEKDVETIDGRKISIYEAEVKKADGTKIDIKVREDGKLIKIDKD